VKRRAFITLLAGAAMWPLAARAQQRERIRRIGVLMATAGDDPESRKRLFALLQGLQQLGWVEGRNLRVHSRYRAVGRNPGRGAGGRGGGGPGERA
jgi:putative tryptophan/tyrosine transport system substrate-binding protein